MRPKSPLGAGRSSMGSRIFFDAMFNKFLLSNNEDKEACPMVDMHGCDQFRMFKFKMRGRSHDWTGCLFARARKLGDAIRGGTTTRGRHIRTFKRGAVREAMHASLCTECSSASCIRLNIRRSRAKIGGIAIVRCIFFAYTPKQL